MKSSLVVLVISLGMLGAGWVVSPELMLLGALCSVGGVYLLARAVFRQLQQNRWLEADWERLGKRQRRGKRQGQQRGQQRGQRQGQQRGQRGGFLLLDGSNIMHWRGGAPDLTPVREVIAQVAAQGYTPGVVFDANAGHKLEGRYLHHPTLARELGLPQSHVMVVNKGEVADGLILRAARDYGARVISNDRFRDWAGDFPEVATPGFLIAGRYRAGRLDLDLA